MFADGIHSLLAEKKIGREQENELYELIGKVFSEQSCGFALAPLTPSLAAR